MVQFCLKLLLKQRFLAAYHDFHWFQPENSIPFMLRSRSWKFWKVGVGGRSRKFWKIGVKIRSWMFYLRLRNPGANYAKLCQKVVHPGPKGNINICLALCLHNDSRNYHKNLSTKLLPMYQDNWYHIHRATGKIALINGSINILSTTAVFAFLLPCVREATSFHPSSGLERLSFKHERVGTFGHSV